MKEGGITARKEVLQLFVIRQGKGREKGERMGIEGWGRIDTDPEEKEEGGGGLKIEKKGKIKGEKRERGREREKETEKERESWFTL